MPDEEKTEYTTEELKAIIEKLNADPTAPRQIYIYTFVWAVVYIIIVGGAMAMWLLALHYLGWFIACILGGVVVVVALIIEAWRKRSSTPQD